jgi:phosphopantetheinyl transferase
MPIFLKKTFNNNGQVAIWKIDEPMSFFKQQSKITAEERDQVDELASRKKLEWYASRYLLQFLFGEKDEIICIKDEHGKPHLKNSDHHISLSHSNEMTAVISSKNLVGVDIQKIVPKIKRISKKFIGEEEEKKIGYSNRIEKMHIIWGAKECLYKAYGKRSLDFKKNLFISDFDYKPEGCSFHGSLKKDTTFMDFECWAGKFENYMLVYAIKT